MDKLSKVMITKDIYILLATGLIVAFLLGFTPVVLLIAGAAIDRAARLDQVETALNKTPPDIPSDMGKFRDRR